MSDLGVNLEHFFPWVSFLAGLGGSLHCVGMCGGLVTASCEKGQHVARYQVGRLLGYLVLSLFAGFLGSLFHFKFNSPLLTMAPGIFIGVLFLFWGVQSFRGKKAELPLPRFLGKFYSFLWKKLVFQNLGFSKSFFTGLISIFLPCGLLYGIILGTFSLQNSLLAMISMFFFWLGTVPSMVIAPSLFQKIINPLRGKLPKTYAVSLIAIGLMTVSFRMVKLHEMTTPSASKIESTKHSCH